MRHTLQNLDADTLTADCAVCGPASPVLKISAVQYQCTASRRASQQAARRRARAAGKVYALSNRDYIGHRKDACERIGCPYGADHLCLLDVHHLDGNRANNDSSNLVTLCAFCHRLVTYRVNELHYSGDEKGYVFLDVP